MKIISWNLNHRTREKPIPDGVCDFISKAAPDVLVLNEYVDGPSRDEFKSKLHSFGYAVQLVSEKIDGHNQIFIASKSSLETGDLDPPGISDASLSNFLHFKIPSENLEVVGLRVPMYKSSRDRERYWEALSRILQKAVTRRIVFVGDLNDDPIRRPNGPLSRIKKQHAEAFTIPEPEGEWSYISSDGSSSTRIDHAIVSMALHLDGAKYLAEFGSLKLAGPRSIEPISDHAALEIELS